MQKTPRIDLRAFRTRLGRRMVLLFFLCALVPVIGLGLDSYRRVSRQLRDQGQERLGQMAKAAGMAIVERLGAAATELELFESSVASGLVNSARNPGSMLAGATLVRPDGSARHISGSTFALPRLNATQEAHLQAGDVVLAAVAGSGDPNVLLGHASEALGGVLWAAVSTDSIVMTARIFAETPERETLCVQASPDLTVYCSRGLSPDSIAKAATVAGDAIDSSLRWREGTLTRIAHQWSLFLKPGFGSESWTITVADVEETQLASLQDFRRLLPRVLVFALGLVFLLSYQQIQRSLRPLEQLQSATRRLMKREFGARVEIESRDEFQVLGEAFNQMAGELGQQFAALTTINHIDRAVLSSLDQEHVIDSLLEQAGNALPADAIAVTVLNGEGEATTCASSAGNAEGKQQRDVRLTESELRRLDEEREHLLLGPDEPAPSYLDVAPFATERFPNRLVLPIWRKGRLSGAITIGSRAGRAYRPEEIQRARQLADQVAVALANVHLVKEMEDLSEGAMTALARSVDAKSSWTAGHSERVTTVALAIARQLGMSDAELKLLHRGGLLHDIGKIGIPSALLNKPGPLTPEERKIVQSHVTVGERILEPIRAFADILPLVRSHHERFDGSGYPDGLTGTEIHRLARVMTVADVFDALSSDRPYRPAFSATRTLAVIREGRGVHYDPEIVDAFLEVMSFELVDRVPEQEAPEELYFHVPSRSV